MINLWFDGNIQLPKSKEGNPVKNEVLECLKEMIEEKYGDLTDECGCYVRHEWLSIAEIVKLIDLADSYY